MGLIWIQAVWSCMIYVIHMVKSVYISLQVVNNQAPFLTINDKSMTFNVLGLIWIQTVWSCMIYVIHMAKSVSVTYIRVTRNSNKIPILNSNNTVVYLTQVNEGNSISFIYTIGFYRCFGIHSIISLRLPKLLTPL